MRRLFFRHCLDFIAPVVARRAVLVATLLLVGCGGGGGSGSAAGPAVVPAAARPVDQSDQEIAQSTYSGAARTPSDFYKDEQPAGYDYVATMHLKNSDTDSGVVAPLVQYEMCTNDWNQALSWSETSAQNASQYTDLVATNETAHYFEFGRTRPSEPQFYSRVRVFKCNYLDRSSANLRVAAGAAGQLNQRPLNATELRNLSEYLWQFTTYNNFGHVVLKSSGANTTTTLTHTLYMANLVRAGYSATCDRIDVVTWRHVLDTGSGSLQLEVQTLWSFGARDAGGGVAQLCSG